MKNKLLLLSRMAVFTLLLIPNWGMAQMTSQTVRGIVLDKTSEQPLVNVSVEVLGNSHKIGTVTDESGRYTLKGVPFGRQQFSYTCIGYQMAIILEVLVTAGKEVVLDISLEQKIVSLKEITLVSTTTKKGAATNEFSAGSARSFNLDEVTRYAGGRNDPSKLVSNYAGAAANSDARNDTVVRGNSPSGVCVLWRINGIPSPNPNHFSTLGTTGGPLSALNTNALNT